MTEVTTAMAATRPRLTAPAEMLQETRWVDSVTKVVDFSYDMDELLGEESEWEEDGLMSSLSCLDQEATFAKPPTRGRGQISLMSVSSDPVLSEALVGEDEEISPSLRAAIRELESIDGFLALLLFERGDLRVLYRGEDAALDEDFSTTVARDFVARIMELELQDDLKDMTMTVRGAHLMWCTLPAAPEYIFSMIVEEDASGRNSAWMILNEVLETLAMRRAENVVHAA